MKRFRILILALAAVVLGCGGFDLKSTWRDRNVVIDGAAGDWQGVLTSVDEKGDVGFLNDGEHLYICFIPRDRNIENQMIVRGLTLWFDPQGGEEKHFGVRFPLGLIENPDAMQQMAMMRQTRNTDRSEFLDEFAHTLSHLEVLTARDTTRLGVDDSAGLEVAIGVSRSNSLIYEIKVPLRESTEFRYAIGATKKNVIGVGLETPEIDFETLRNEMRARGGGRARAGMGGGRSGGGTGGGGGMGGGMRGRPEIPEPLKAWGKLLLADS